MVKFPDDYPQQRKRHPPASRHPRQLRGQFYSVIAILIAVPIALFTVTVLLASQAGNQQAVDHVVADQMHQVELSVEDDFVRAFEISALRAILAIDNSVVTTGQFVDNSIARIGELMLYGTLYGNQSQLMQGQTLADWRQKILGIPTGYAMNFTYIYPVLDRVNGTQLDGTMDLSINVSDQFGAANIRKRVTVPFSFSVEGYEDPVYPAFTNGFVKRPYVTSKQPYYAKKLATGTSAGNCTGNVSFNPAAPDGGKILVVPDAAGLGSGFAGVVAEQPNRPAAGVSCFVIGAPNAVSLVSLAMNLSNYSAIYLDNLSLSVWHLPLNDVMVRKEYMRGYGPTVFRRMEGNLTGEGNSTTLFGLESFVNIPELQDAGVPIKEDTSLFDAIYFSNATANGKPAKCQPLCFPSWFRIDQSFADFYGFRELIQDI